jgi:arginine decarboxylase-like protein
MGKIRRRSGEIRFDDDRDSRSHPPLEGSRANRYAALLHFHIGSQLTDIKRIKNAMKEAARVYAKIRQMNIPIQYLDVGGGMAVDYDGSKTAFESSANYNAQEFANDVIYVIKTVCDDENVPHPTIIQESGVICRLITRFWSRTFRTKSKRSSKTLRPITVDEDDPQVVKELFDLRENINGKNYREYYHDALENREELFTMFNLGLISLEDRGKGEVLFWDVCERADNSRSRKNTSPKSSTICAACSAPNIWRISGFSLDAGQLGFRTAFSDYPDS